MHDAFFPYIGRSPRALALAAMLLLAFVPTVSRLLAAREAGPGWVELCTMTGLKQVWLGGTAMPPGSGHAVPDDCAYCPLLGALGMVALVVLALRALAQRLPRLQELATAWDACPAPGTLGARGPPRLA